MENQLHSVGNSPKDFTGQSFILGDPNELAAESNYRLTEKFSVGIEASELTEYNAHATRLIIRTLRDLQNKILNEELNKQEAESNWNAANNQLKHLNTTYDEIKAIYEHLDQIADLT